MWNAIITMTSVGYGDFYPASAFGRFVGIITSFWGVCFASLLTYSVFMAFEFTKKEKASYDLIRKVVCQDEVK